MTIMNIGIGGTVWECACRKSGPLPRPLWSLLWSRPGPASARQHQTPLSGRRWRCRSGVCAAKHFLRYPLLTVRGKREGVSGVEWKLRMVVPCNPRHLASCSADIRGSMQTVACKQWLDYTCIYIYSPAASGSSRDNSNMPCRRTASSFTAGVIAS